MPAGAAWRGRRIEIMGKTLTMIVAWFTRVHNAILSLNDKFETSFTDKELHFLVIGAIGLALIMLIYPFFKWLANRNKVLAITWIYVLTVLVVLTFAIEIGQSVTGMGTMEFGDVVAGMGGFFVVTAVIAALHFLIWVVRSLVKLGKKRREHRHTMQYEEEY